MGSSGSPLAFWISTSLALHLVVAAAWLATPPASQPPAQARQLAVEILNGGETQPHRTEVRPTGDFPTAMDSPPAPADRAEARRPTLAEPQPRRAEARPADTLSVTEVPLVGRASARHADATEPTPPTSQATAPLLAPDVSIVQRLQVRLLERLAEQLRYPPLARARGWEGVVLMELRLEANGDISHLQVLESSGYPLLDRAATQGLQRVARLPQARGWLRGEAFELVLPVHYRLIDS
jgi:protein TonB